MGVILLHLKNAQKGQSDLFCVFKHTVEALCDVVFACKFIVKLVYSYPELTTKFSAGNRSLAGYLKLVEHASVMYSQTRHQSGENFF